MVDANAAGTAAKDAVSLPDHIRDTIMKHWPAMEGWTTEERACEMAEMTITIQPEVSVTIGVFGCRSVIAQALALRENQHGVVYGIDPFKVDAALEGENEENKNWWSKNVDMEDIQKKAINEIWKHGLDQWAVLIRASSQHVAQLFPSICVLEIDGNHSEVASCRDVELYVPRLKPGGVLFMDDVWWPSTKKALALIEKDCDVIRDRGNYRIYQKR